MLVALINKLKDDCGEFQLPTRATPASLYCTPASTVDCMSVQHSDFLAKFMGCECPYLHTTGKAIRFTCKTVKQLFASQGVHKVQGRPEAAHGDSLLLNVHSLKQVRLLNSTSRSTPAFLSVLATMHRCSHPANNQPIMPACSTSADGQVCSQLDPCHKHGDESGLTCVAASRTAAKRSPLMSVSMSATRRTLFTNNKDTALRRSAV